MKNNSNVNKISRFIIAQPRVKLQARFLPSLVIGFRFFVYTKLDSVFNELFSIKYKYLLNKIKYYLVDFCISFRSFTQLRHLNLI